MSATYDYMCATEAKLADCCVNCGLPTQVTYLLPLVVHNSKEDMMLSNMFKNEDPLMGTHPNFVYFRKKVCVVHD